MDLKKVNFIRVNEDTLKTEITEDEKKFRESQFLDESCVLKKKVNCTACGKNIKGQIINKDIHVHPVLDVLWCKKCEKFYHDGEFSTDEDGSDKYCRWCGQGGSLYCCSYCSVVFCEKCIERNIPLKMLKNIDGDDWKCFVCDTEPLWSLRAFCENVKTYVGLNSGSERYRQKSLSEENTIKRKRKKNSFYEKYFITETNKIKRNGESSRKKKVNDKSTIPKSSPDGKNKKKFKIFQNAINESAALRKLWMKNETRWRKNYFNANDVTFETVFKSEEEFKKCFSDIKTGMNVIENLFLNNFSALKNVLSKSEEENEPSPIKENESMIIESIDVEIYDEDITDASVVSDVEREAPEMSPRKASDDTSLTIFDQDSTTNETDESKKSISDSLVVNGRSSNFDSLNSEEENELCNEVVIEDEDMADVSIVPETVEERKSEKSPCESCINSVIGTDDMSLTIFDVYSDK